MAMYHMRIVYGIDTSIRELNRMTALMDNTRAVLGNAMEITIEQTVSFVPTKEHLDQYAQAIAKCMNDGDGPFQAENVQFLRYDLFEQVSS